MIRRPHLDRRAPARSRDVDLAPLRGEADRVLDEVREDLSDLDGIGFHRRELGPDRRPDHDALQRASHPLEHRADHLVDQDRLLGRARARPPASVRDPGGCRRSGSGDPLPPRPCGGRPAAPHRCKWAPSASSPDALALMDASGVRRSWVTEEKRAARSAFASTWSRASRTSPSRGRPLDRERRLRRERLHETELGWGERLLARSPHDASEHRRSPTGRDERDRDRLPRDRSLLVPAVARPTPSGVAMSQLASPKKSRSACARPSRMRPKGSLEMKRSVVLLRKSASVARCSARERSSLTLLTRAPTMSADRRNAMSATTSDACRTASV